MNGAPGSRTEEPLDRHYLRYIDVLNGRRFDDLPAFVADELSYNDEPISGVQYREMLEDDVRRIPDLFFDVRHLVVAEDQVACRLRFECTPVEAFQGFEPTGEPVVFTEHVFYRFEGDHIVQVWSLLDLGALQRQSIRGEA